MESLIRLCWRLAHSTPNAYCPLSLRGRWLGVKLVMAEVVQPTSSKGSSASGRNFFKISIKWLSVTQGAGGCKVGFGCANRAGCFLTLPPKRGRSPPAARRSAEVVWSIPEFFHLLCCCGPGRSAVRSWWLEDP